MWEEKPEYQKVRGVLFLVYIGLISLAILAYSVLKSDYIYILGWIGGLLIFGIACTIYGIIAIGFAKTIFAMLKFFDRKRDRK
ncbi:MAG TPA: hypothetical protein DET40_21235 [Lentisphaeria bacterium]|nr:MAG: hypothetical protein A2X45_03145 [Lentisphaerae bacterium GWF2_50_93]HCE46076.1 hypothetical protein [Lentisphaeria bacterium]